MLNNGFRTTPIMIWKMRAWYFIKALRLEKFMADVPHYITVRNNKICSLILKKKRKNTSTDGCSSKVYVMHCRFRIRSIAFYLLCIVGLELGL